MKPKYVFKPFADYGFTPTEEQRTIIDYNNRMILKDALSRDFGGVSIRNLV